MTDNLHHQLHFSCGLVTGVKAEKGYEKSPSSRGRKEEKERGKNRRAAP